MTETDYDYFESKAELDGAIDTVSDKAFEFIDRVNDYRLSSLKEDPEFDSEWSDYIPDDVCDDLEDKASEFKDTIRSSLEGVEPGEKPDINSMADELSQCLSKHSDMIPSAVLSDLESMVNEIESALNDISSLWDTCVSLFNIPDNPMNEDEYADF